MFSSIFLPPHKNICGQNKNIANLPCPKDLGEKQPLRKRHVLYGCADENKRRTPDKKENIFFA
jgi:hypothetical protein